MLKCVDTRRRPIAAGRIEPAGAISFGAVLSVAGVAYLVVTAECARGAAGGDHARELFVCVHAAQTTDTALHDDSAPFPAPCRR
jgi:hypothetical protein